MSNDTSFEGRTHSDAGCVPELRSPLSVSMDARQGNVAMAESVAALVHPSGCCSRWRYGRLLHVYVPLASTLS